MYCNLTDSTIPQHSMLLMLSHPPAVGRSSLSQFPLPLQAQPGLPCRGGRLLAWAVKEYQPTRAAPGSSVQPLRLKRLAPTEINQNLFCLLDKCSSGLPAFILKMSLAFTGRTGNYTLLINSSSGEVNTYTDSAPLLCLHSPIQDRFTEKGKKKKKKL